MPDPIHVGHIKDLPGQPGSFGEHVHDVMRPQVVKSLALQTGLAESPEMIQAQDELWGFWNGNGVDKVVVEGGHCERCGKALGTLTVESRVGPGGFNADQEHDGRMYAKRRRRLPAAFPRALVEYGATCDCGGRIVFRTREISPGEDW